VADEGTLCAQSKGFDWLREVIDRLRCNRLRQIKNQENRSPRGKSAMQSLGKLATLLAQSMVMAGFTKAGKTCCSLIPIRSSNRGCKTTACVR
jgi:hypothetical protein